MESRDKIVLPNVLVLEQVQEFLQLGKTVIIAVKGMSMVPFLKEGERVVLHPFERSELKRGAIVLAIQDNQMVLHRVVNIGRRRITLAGDANLVQHEQLDEQDVLAVAVTVLRGDKQVNLLSRWRRRIGLLWYWARPFRRIIKKIV